MTMICHYDISGHSSTTGKHLLPNTVQIDSFALDSILFIKTVFGQIMKQLQKWFNLIAGVSEAERHRLAFAHAVFGQSGPDLTALSRPACWRRNPLIRIDHLPPLA